MKILIRFSAIVFSFLLCVTLAQAEVGDHHDCAPGVGHDSLGGGVHGEMDANGDGLVSSSEFGDFHSRQFNVMDGDKNGMLTMDEMNAGGKMVTGNTATSHLDMRFSASDSNQNGGLDRNEAGGMPMLSMYFDEVDVNKDGQVTKQEYFDAMPLLHKAKQDKANAL